jgi:hypothetical protein
VVDVRERKASNESRNNVSIIHKMWTSNVLESAFLFQNAAPRPINRRKSKFNSVVTAPWATFTCTQTATAEQIWMFLPK